VADHGRGQQLLSIGGHKCQSAGGSGQEKPWCPPGDLVRRRPQSGVGGQRLAKPDITRADSSQSYAVEPIRRYPESASVPQMVPGLPRSLSQISGSA
jgi:hypothetical protein